MNDTAFENILAVETSSFHLKLALSFGGDRLVKSDEAVDRSHGRVIIRKIENLLSSAGLKPRDIDGIVVSTGPGSFTGLRIGLSATKGMAVALGVPLIGISLFELAAWKLRENPDLLFAAVQVRREELLLAQIEHGAVDFENVLAVPILHLKQIVGNVAVIGIGLDIATIDNSVSLVDGQSELEIDPADLLCIGQTRLQAGERSDLDLLEPLYIQKSQAEIRFEQRRQQS